MLILYPFDSTKRKFGDDYFRFFLSLVLVQCVVNAVFARVGKSPLLLCLLLLNFSYYSVCSS